MVKWDINPEIFRIGFFALRWYSLMFMCAFISGYYILYKIFKLENKPSEDVSRILIYVFWGTLIGARLGHCLFYDPAFYLSHPLEILKVYHGGLASHGAAIGIFISLYLFVKRSPGYSYLWLFDRLVIPIALAASFVRIGNLFNSEIIGKPTNLPWSFVFERVDMIPRHPTQIYEALAYFIIFLLLFRYYKRNRSNIHPGYILGWFFVGMFTFRFLVEFLKENQSAFESHIPLDMGQWLSIPIIIIGLYLIIRAKNTTKVKSI